jgi:hypothetical protein
VPRRVRMPGADELFRSTGSGGRGGSGPLAVGSAALAPRASADRLRAVPDPVEDETGQGAQIAPAHAPPTRSAVRSGLVAPARGATGRERHDEKITVYVSPEELLGLERARILLRAEHALAVDRGRIVREAIDLILADFDANGEQSLLVDSLRYPRD